MVLTFPKNEWDDIRSRLDARQNVFTIRVDQEFGKYREGDFLTTEWGQEVKIVFVRRVSGGLDALRNEYQFFSELTDEMLTELKHHDEMEIISLKSLVA